MEKMIKEHSNDENVDIIAEDSIEIEDNSWTKIKCKGWNQDKTPKENACKVATNKGWSKKKKNKSRKE